MQRIIPMSCWRLTSIWMDVEQMLDTAWTLFGRYFNRSELGIKEEIVNEFGKNIQ